MKYLIIGTVLVSAVIILLAITLSHRHNEDCKWIAPLKTNYVMCSDGKVREK